MDVSNMNSKIQIASYELDTLQIYFSWDDDLYTYFKEKGLGTKGQKNKKLPLIYTDNCIRTTGVKQRKRKYVISPQEFGETYENLGWIQTKRKTEPIIGCEKPLVEISLTDKKKNLEFKVIPRTQGKEQYHLEYSSMSSFGSMYNNWSILVLRMQDFKDLLNKLKDWFPEQASGFVDIPIHEEKKQNQRERLVYAEVPIESYSFSMGEFLYMKKYFEANGITGKLPSMVFKDEPAYRELMDPTLKLGFVHTTGEDGFEIRKPQCAMKIAQPKITTSKRGKRAKMKGKIVITEIEENCFVVPAKQFALSAHVLNQRAPAFFET